ncbi:MAG: 50S ribosomal protein L24 [Bacteroidetes bacterium]|nr:MAG: 50S ribosomal protein L24 [Bacteroidota bacterium]REK05138.1 MAG: 50S ribosomal protein L24 [Bacteroidota bacterium]REK32543.1 MAG: 50S ribosomal protein L24 [Bacteroidota bacterium]REK49010.1 MAG: 50S ribosomal protein L24 [Bacteroidota bacterium]
MERKYNKQQKLNIRKGDIVKVISGDSRGTQGRVLDVFRKERRVLVEGVNMVSKHTKPNAKNTQGGIVKKEAPIHISNVMLVDGKGNATRIGRKMEGDELVRYSKKSGEVIK